MGNEPLTGVSGEIILTKPKELAIMWHAFVCPCPSGGGDRKDAGV